MSELAYDVNGEPISLPASAQLWKVRRFRNPGMRGAPEIVIDREGAPLLLPIDCSFVDFRELVDAQPGRYRLDPLDERRKVVSSVAAAYVTLNEPLRNSTPHGGPADERDLVIRDLVRAHVDMVKTMSERFSSMMEAGASLLRAADAAGITTRKPPESPPPPEDEDEDDEEEDEDEEDDEDEKPSDMVELLKQVMPMIQMYLATKMGGVDFPGAPSIPTVPAAPSSALNTTAPFTVSAPSAPAPAQASATPAAVPPPAVTASVGATAPRNVDPTPTPSQMAHVASVQAKLTPAEARIAMAAAMRMPAEARAQWFAELCARSVDDAVALIRANLPNPARSPAVQAASSAQTPMSPPPTNAIAAAPADSATTGGGAT